jgi:hypothetical protein
MLRTFQMLVSLTRRFYRLPFPKYFDKLSNLKARNDTYFYVFIKLHAWAANACIQYGDHTTDRIDDESLFHFLQNQKMSLYSKALSMVLGPTQTPTHSVLLFYLRGV